MQNTTPVPVPDGNLQRTADGSRIYVFERFTTTDPGFKSCEHPPWGRPAQSIVEAVRAGDLAKVTSLVADPSYSPADYLEIALIAAISAGQLEIGRYLLDHGAVMDKPAPRMIPGMRASSEKSLPFLKLFVERGWDVNFIECDRTALLWEYHMSNWTTADLTCLSDVIRDPELVTWLLAHGADPNLGRGDNGITWNGGNLLELAALWSTVEVFDKLIAHGARLEDSRALHHAAARRAPGPLGQNDTRLMAHLLELGVDINEPDHKGDERQNGLIGPPIFWAIHKCEFASIKFLVENGADLTVKGPYGSQTAAAFARRKCGNKERVEYYESIGVRNVHKEIAEYLESVSPRDV